MDMTITHSTCSSYINANYLFLKDKLIQRREAYANGYQAAASTENTPAVARASIKKHVKYGLIERLINLQALVGAIPQHATFVPCVLSHRGEMGSEFIDVVEILCTNYKQLRRSRPFFDGLTPTKATTLFRSDLLLAIFSALARGWGTQLLTVGSPYLQ